MHFKNNEDWFDLNNFAKTAGNFPYSQYSFFLRDNSFIHGPVFHFHS